MKHKFKFTIGDVVYCYSPTYTFHKKDDMFIVIAINESNNRYLCKFKDRDEYVWQDYDVIELVQPRKGFKPTKRLKCYKANYNNNKQIFDEWWGEKINKQFCKVIQQMQDRELLEMILLELKKKNENISENR